MSKLVPARTTGLMMAVVGDVWFDELCNFPYDACLHSGSRWLSRQ